MECVFGPVPSKRLGRSLGIDPVPPKTCNFSCVYCQLGRTKHLTNERRAYIPEDEIMAQFEDVLERHTPGTIDWVTFVGSGETALHAGLGRLIRRARRVTPLPLAVITNGSLLSRPEVRDELMAADAVLPSLDAGSPELFREINRPHPECTFEQQAEGLVEFRKLFRGQLWLEVMLVASLNDSDQALREIAAVTQRIKPDEIHIGVPTRPPAEPWVRPPGEDSILQAIEILGTTARVQAPAIGDFDLGGGEDIVEAVLSIITRHPMRHQELVASLSRWDPERVEGVLDALQAGGRAKVVERLGSLFWSASQAAFPDEDKRRAARREGGR
jgi:wyosine [tRNA(Phe)-imidazoG37] synthetase (radical SAM superfamily)